MQLQPFFIDWLDHSTCCNNMLLRLGAAVLGLEALRETLVGLPESWQEGTDPCGTANCGMIAEAACSWSGLVCSGWRVEQINLSSLGLTGSLPDTGFNMTSLKSLTLRANQISGPLPPSWGYSVEALELLDLSQNSFQETLPAAWLNMRNLKELYVGENELFGEGGGGDGGGGGGAWAEMQLPGASFIVTDTFIITRG
jgi:hypothetical protein